MTHLIWSQTSHIHTYLIKSLVWVYTDLDRPMGVTRHNVLPQRTHDAITTSLLRQNDIVIMTLLLRRVPTGLVFTRVQFWLSGIVVACVCVSVSLCVNHLLVRAITQDPFKLGSPNLTQSCKTPWLRSLLFWGSIDYERQGQIQPEDQNLPPF